MNEIVKLSADPDEVAVRTRNLRKVYRLYRRPGYRALDIMGLLPDSPRYFGEHVALHDVNLDIRRGEKIAIIGRNGAGKSTLLRLLTGVVQPTSGTLDVSGQTQALLSLGTGFHPELTGRQNALAYVANFGISGQKAKGMIDEIIEFAELEEYIDQPMKTYSTGMGMRLMFAASTLFVPDLLVIDEVLGVGDAYFQAKSFERIREICTARGATLLLVSHDIFTASQLCERMIWIDNGAVLLDADSATVLKAYDASIRQQEEMRLRKKAMLNLQRMIEDAPDDSAALVIELRSPTNTPAAAPVQIARIALMDGDTAVAEAALTGGLEEAQATGRMMDSGVWGDVTAWNGRRARTMNNYGSSLHKVAVSFLLPKDIAGRIDDLALEVECGAVDNYALEAWRIDPDLRARSLGILPSNPGQWSAFRAPLSGASAEEKRPDEQAAILRSAEQSGSGRVTITGVSFLDATGVETLQLVHGTAVTIVLGYQISDPTLREHCQISIVFRRNGVHDAFRLFGKELLFDASSTPVGQIEVKMARLPLPAGEYTMSILLAGENYFDEKPRLFYTINPKVYWVRRSVGEISVTAEHLIAQGTGVIGQADWALASLNDQAQSTFNPIFKLLCDPANRNWSLGTGETGVEIRSECLVVTSDKSISSYQIVTNPIAVAQRSNYILLYAVRVLEGSMGIGVLDGASGNWIASSPIAEPRGSLLVEAQSDKIVLVLFNNNETKQTTTAEVSLIALHQVGPAGAAVGSVLTAA